MFVKKIINTNESRKSWLLRFFKSKGYRLRRISNYKVWQDGTHPIFLDSEYLYNQKLNYIHENPCVAGYVDQEEDWQWSSAMDYEGKRGRIQVEILT